MDHSFHINQKLAVRRELEASHEAIVFIKCSYALTVARPPKSYQSSFRPGSHVLTIRPNPPPPPPIPKLRFSVPRLACLLPRPCPTVEIFMEMSSSVESRALPSGENKTVNPISSAP